MLKLENIKLHTKMQETRADMEKNKKEIFSEIQKCKANINSYKKKLEATENELVNLKKEKELLEKKYQKIPLFIRKIFN